MPILETSPHNFIKLKHITIASYAIQYQINSCFDFQTLEQITSKHQFYYKGMRHKAQLLELMLVDTAFAEVLGKLAQEVFLGKVRTLSDFILLHQQTTIIKNFNDACYYQFKFEAWLKQLFFPANELEQHQNSKSNFIGQQEHVYVFKNDADELVYCSHFDGKKLFEMLINSLQLRIDSKKSKLAKDQVTLVLNLEMH